MPEPIRILQMIGSLEIGGSQSMIINLYNAIDRNKVQFDFVVDHPDNVSLAPVVEKLGAKIIYMPTFKGYNVAEIKKAWNNFFANHPEYKVLHSHVRSYASLYIPIAKKYGVKTIIHSHSTSNGTGFSAIVKKIMQYPLRYQADYFFGCSKEAGKWLFGKHIVNTNKFHILRNAIDLEKYIFSDEARQNYRRTLNINDNTVYLHVGRFNEAKNHGFLLKLFRSILLKDPNAKLVLVGDGSRRQYIENTIYELGLSDSVILLGSREDVAPIMWASDCFLFPSLWEGLGMVAIEAQAAGLPCICSNTIPDEVKIKSNCVFLPLDSIDQWVNTAIAMACKRDNRNEEIKKAGYDIKESAEFIESFYKKLDCRLKDK